MRKKLLALMDSAVRFLSAERLLDLHPNGGTTVFVRSLWVTGIFFGTMVILNVLLHWDCDRSTLPSDLRAATIRIAPYAGGVFAFAYTALYARFASQWSYLAGVYNQIMAAQVCSSVNEAAMSRWQAGFIEDAYELHLYGKPMFLAVIHSMLEKPKVKEAFCDGVAGGKDKLTLIEDAMSQLTLQKKPPFERAASSLKQL